MKKFICSLLPFLLLSAGCTSATPAETAQSLESVEETESLPEGNRLNPHPETLPSNFPTLF